MWKLLPILALLLLPTLAHAAPSGTFTDPRTGVSYTIAATDKYETTTTPSEAFGYMNTGTQAVAIGTAGLNCQTVWGGNEANGWDGKAQWIAAGSPRSNTSCVPMGGSIVAHTYSRLMFADIPEVDRWRFGPTASLTVAEYFVEGQLVKTTDAVVNNGSTKPIGTQLPTYCSYYAVEEGSMGPTPPSVLAACIAAGLPVKKPAAPVVPKPAKPATPSPKPQTINVPASAAKCKAVGKVAVRSVAVKCTSARTVIARYAKSLKSPAGWTCTAVVTDSGRRARCTVKPKSGRAAAKAAVYGLWASK